MLVLLLDNELLVRLENIFIQLLLNSITTFEHKNFLLFDFKSFCYEELVLCVIFLDLHLVQLVALFLQFLKFLNDFLEH